MAETTADRLRKLVESIIEQEPFAHEGHAWAAMSQDWYCDQLGISPETLRRIIGRPPFVRKVKS